MNKLEYDEKVINIIKYAYCHTQFYKELYDKLKIDINNLRSIKELPFISSLDLVHKSLFFKTDELIYKVSVSSGTKNYPKILFRTWEDFQRSVKNQIFLMKQCNLTEKDVIGIIQPFGICGYGELTQYAAKKMKIPVIPIGNIDDYFALDLLIKLKVTVLDISPSRLKRLYQIARSEKKDHLLKIKKIMSAGENLSPALRSFFEKEYNLVFYNQYGSEETDSLGYEIDKGIIQLLERDFFIEIIKSDGQYAKENEVGELVVTSLYHIGTPLIRYRLGDEVKIVNESPLQVKILGRGNDVCNLFDSVKISASFIDDILKEYDIVDWQCHIYEDKKRVNVFIYVDAQKYNDVELNKISAQIKKCNIDVNELVNSGYLKFTIINNKDKIIIKNHRKTLRFIDMRDK